MQEDTMGREVQEIVKVVSTFSALMLVLIWVNHAPNPLCSNAPYFIYFLTKEFYKKNQDTSKFEGSNYEEKIMESILNFIRKTCMIVPFLECPKHQMYMEKHERSPPLKWNP